MKTRVAICSGVRTPYCKANGILNEMQADDLGAFAVKELYTRASISPEDIDQVVLGNVMQPSHATNIARVIAVKAGLPVKVPAVTVNRNCASGMDAIVEAANQILLGEADVIIAGGVESMSNFPVLFSKKMQNFLLRLNKSKSFFDKLKMALSFRPSFLKPHIPEIYDPLCGLSMGQTAEILSKEFKVTREEQDAFSLESNLRAARATADGRFKEEIVPVPIPTSYDKYQQVDDGPRGNTTFEALQKLKPVFDKIAGSVTAGNSSQVTDGACVLLLMSEEKAKKLGIKPLGYLTAFAVTGLDPARMGLGPIFSTAKLFKESGYSLKDIDLIEINEAFAAQVLAVRKAFNSKEFAAKQLGLTSALGEIDPNKLNVNGGAIALGHPLGASGARLILTLLLELRKRKLKRGLATLCVGGGQGQAAIVEVE